MCLTDFRKPTGGPPVMSPGTLAVVLAAALDPGTSDEALAITAGNADHVRRAATRPDGDAEATIGIRTIARQAGVSTNGVERHLAGAERIGLLYRVDRGCPGKVVDGHGLAAAYVPGEVTAPSLDDLDERADWATLAVVLHPQRVEETNGDGEPYRQPWGLSEAGRSGWRAVLVLLAALGASNAEKTIHVADLAAHCGKSDRAIRDTLRRLETLGVVVRHGRRRAWTPEALIDLIWEMKSGPAYLDEAAEDQEIEQWQDGRTEYLASIQERTSEAFAGWQDPEVGRIEPEPGAAIRALQTGAWRTAG